MRNEKLRKVLKEIVITMIITIILALTSISAESRECVNMINIEHMRINIINPYNIETKEKIETQRIYLTEEEKALLFTTIYLEMGSENLSKESRLVIGSTIINRVLSDKYANTLKDVVYQKNQYSVVRKMNSNKEYKSNILYYSDYLKSINYEWLADEIWDVVDKVCITDYSSGGLHFCEYSSISKANKKWFDSLEFIGEWHGVRIYK